MLILYSSSYIQTLMSVKVIMTVIRNAQTQLDHMSVAVSMDSFYHLTRELVQVLAQNKVLVIILIFLFKIFMFTAAQNPCSQSYSLPILCAIVGGEETFACTKGFSLSTGNSICEGELMIYYMH